MKRTDDLEMTKDQDIIYKGFVGGKEILSKLQINRFSEFQESEESRR